MKWMFRQLGRPGYPFQKCLVLFFIISTLPLSGYGYKAGQVWLATPPCYKTELTDLNRFKYRNPDALSDKELACLIKRSEFPRSEWEWLFKTVYCESSKMPSARRIFGKSRIGHYGLTMLSEVNFSLLHITNERVLYDPERNLHYAYELWKVRKRQPWSTDSNAVACRQNGPNMDAGDIRDGWDWAEPTFSVYFRTGLEQMFHEVRASIL